MKKKICILALMLILFNFIYANYCVYATSDPAQEPAAETEEDSDRISSDDFR
ncbi:MAG: hypothetical protein IJ867_05460 [Clostridia bacterium]|nr:hypothetical protein [Clostridia bacterium]